MHDHISKTITDLISSEFNSRIHTAQAFAVLPKRNRHGLILKLLDFTKPPAGYAAAIKRQIAAGETTVQDFESLDREDVRYLAHGIRDIVETMKPLESRRIYMWVRGWDVEKVEWIEKLLRGAAAVWPGGEVAFWLPF